MDVIISIAAILKIFLYHFFATLHSMTVPNLMSKVFSYQDLHSGGRYVRPLPPPPFRAWSDKNTPGQVGLIY